MNHRDPIDDALSAIDRALDVGQQETTDPAPTARSEGCVRCNAEDLAHGSEMCGPCRAFMLGDTAIDPKTAMLAERRAETVRHVERLVAAADGGELAASIRRVIDERTEGFADRLAAGDLFVWTESGDLVSGPEAVELVRAVAGLDQ